jgi:hypothetical protein
VYCPGKDAESIEAMLSQDMDLIANYFDWNELLSNLNNAKIRGCFSALRKFDDVYKKASNRLLSKLRDYVTSDVANKIYQSDASDDQ